MDTATHFDSYRSNPLPVLAGRIYRLRLFMKSTIQGFPLRLELHLPYDAGYPHPYLWQRDIAAKKDWRMIETYIEIPLRDDAPESRDAVLLPVFRIRVTLDKKDIEVKYRDMDRVLWLDDVEFSPYVSEVAAGRGVDL